MFASAAIKFAKVRDFPQAPVKYRVWWIFAVRVGSRLGPVLKSLLGNGDFSALVDPRNVPDQTWPATTQEDG